MSVIDIRPIKSELRQKYRSLRQAMPPEIKRQKDEAIAAQVRRLWQYQRNSVLLIYVSTAIEVDTFRIIRGREEGRDDRRGDRRHRRADRRAGSAR